MSILELNHVALHVEDVEASSRFYREVLQLEPIPRPAFDFPGAWFRLGARQELHLIGQRDRPVSSHHRGSHFALAVDSLDCWERHFARKGAEWLPRRKRPDGALQIYVSDPDGHFVELFEPPPALRDRA